MLREEVRYVGNLVCKLRLIRGWVELVLVDYINFFPFWA